MVENVRRKQKAEQEQPKIRHFLIIAKAKTTLGAPYLFCSFSIALGKSLNRPPVPPSGCFYHRLYTRNVLK